MFLAKTPIFVGANSVIAQPPSERVTRNPETLQVVVGGGGGHPLPPCPGGSPMRQNVGRCLRHREAGGAYIARQFLVGRCQAAGSAAQEVPLCAGGGMHTFQSQNGEQDNNLRSMMKTALSLASSPFVCYPS